MILIGTHNSGTGEPSKGLLSHLLIPFAKTQSKSVVEQYNQGCRFFDFRVIFDGDDLRLAHGYWKSKSTLSKVLYELKDKKDFNYIVTYEGKLDNELAEKEFISKVTRLSYINFQKGTIVYIAKKKPKWTVLKSFTNINTEQGFKSLEWFNPYCLIPIPWLLDKICSRPHTFNDTYYKLVDFL